jgi:hypothetical protein
MCEIVDANHIGCANTFELGKEVREYLIERKNCRPSLRPWTAEGRPAHLCGVV